MGRFTIGCLAVIGFFTLTFAAGGAAGVWYWRSMMAQDDPAGPMIAEVDLRGTILEKPAGGWPLEGFGPSEPNLADVVFAIDRAAANDNVKALFARLNGTAHGWGAAQELRAAIERFTQTGKPAIAYATSFGELSPANEGYFLASAFDRIDIQPGALVGLTGLAIAQPSARGLLDLIGIEPNVIKRSEFKSALDLATEYTISPANRSMLEDLLRGFDDHFVKAIASARDIDPGTLRDLIANGPLTANEAQAAGLIDGQSYLGDIRAGLEKEFGADIMPVFAAHSEVGPEPDHIAALITAQGMIFQGNGDNGDGIASEWLAGKLADAVSDPSIDAIVLRLDTGGGSAIASETVAHQVAAAKRAGKPIIISMGNAAASGGYWIAQAADRIIAQPTTITGSIGVILAKPSLNGLLDRLGIDIAEITTGPHAGMWSLSRNFTDAERARLNVLIDDIYLAFKQRVAEGRNLPVEAVEEIARGRVWTGAQALELGLVDRLGGLHEAKLEVSELLEAGDAGGVMLLPYPPPPSAFERLTDFFEGGFDPDFGLSSRIESLRRQILAVQPVAMPPIIIR